MTPLTRLWLLSAILWSVLLFYGFTTHHINVYHGSGSAGISVTQNGVHCYGFEFQGDVGPFSTSC